MNRKRFLQCSVIMAATPLISRAAHYLPHHKPRIRLLRHATLVVEIGGYRILVDPMLSAKEAMDPVPNAALTRRIPMADIPLMPEELQQLVMDIDAVLITHTHRDHWDSAAQEMIPKSKIIFCQPTDADKIQEQGFTDVRPVSDSFVWNRITLHRTGGRHGTGAIGDAMGHVSGFVLQHAEQTIYIAGDTIWCAKVQAALDTHKPKAIVLNAGAPRFLTGDPITMDAADVIRVCEAAPYAHCIAAVHMDTINHCTLSRTALRTTLAQHGLEERVQVPTDGAWIKW